MTAAKRLQQRVLVVDDQPDIAESIAVLLRLSGHEVHIAHDGPGAVALARRILPQLMFLDIGLPGLDGFAVSRQLRADPALRGLRIIAVTAYGSDENRERAVEAGFDQYLLKPVDPRFLESLLGPMPAVMA